MRIGIEAQRLFRTKKHGMDVVVLELIKGLQQIDKVNQYFVFTKEGGDEKCFTPSGNFQVVKTGRSPYPFWEQFTLPVLVKKYKIDLLHCTSNTGPLFLKTPILLTLHDIIFINAGSKIAKGGNLYQRLGNLYRRLVVPRLIPRCKLIITVSDYAKTEIQKYFGIDDHKIVKVYNGISDEFKNCPTNMELSLLKTKYALPEKFVFFFGNTAPKKNLAGTLDAFLNHTSPHTRDRYRLVVADLAEKDLIRVLRSLNSMDSRDKIHLVGYIQQKELVSFFHAAELFLYPSLVESFGLPILESMTCGTPVISSHNASMPEIAGEAALLVDPLQPKELGMAVEDVLSFDKLYQRLVDLGFRRIKKFSYLTMTKQMHKLYLSSCRRV
ncbi:glycosyltransferase family 1 protein [Fulvivirgaceae bacterium BMA12]|uniref:Glycosyltransferase family 1 protein n=1 Tax=Agaribacillus aureus TaxID=3051825 RepID=A0ABT8L1X3_9BACT|nr:glycosyltransferase family 1 protein [Fulvivirgaceae bacterium BMA12]